MAASTFFNGTGTGSIDHVDSLLVGHAPGLLPAGAGVSPYSLSPAADILAKISAMKTWGKAANITVAALLLAGCSANVSDQARELCLKAAAGQVGSDVKPHDLEVMNLGDGLNELLGDGNEPKADDANSMFTVTGDLSWEISGVEMERNMLCTVEFDNGEAGDPHVALT